MLLDKKYTRNTIWNQNCKSYCVIFIIHLSQLTVESKFYNMAVFCISVGQILGNSYIVSKHYRMSLLTKIKCMCDKTISNFNINRSLNFKAFGVFILRKKSLFSKFFRNLNYVLCSYVCMLPAMCWICHLKIHRPALE